MVSGSLLLYTVTTDNLMTAEKECVGVGGEGEVGVCSLQAPAR